MDKLTLTVILSFLVLNTSFAEDINILNNCQKTIFIKAEQVTVGQFTLGAGYSRTVGINRESRALVYAQTGCDSTGYDCDTSEGQFSMSEIHWDSNGRSWYDISMVYGYNLPVRIAPYHPNLGGNCVTSSCTFTIDRDCPNSSKQYKNGVVVGCKNLNIDAVTDYSTAIKRACPDVISRYHDDSPARGMCVPGSSGVYITYC